MTLRPLVFLTLALLAAAPGRSAAVKVEPLQETVGWRLHEAVLHGAPAADHPFDPEQIRIDAEITGSGAHWIVLPAYWHQPYRGAR